MNTLYRIVYKNTLRSPPVFCGVHVVIFLASCVVLLCVFKFLVPCCDVRYDFGINVARFVFSLCVFVRHVSCVPDVASFFRIIHLCLSLRFSLTFIYILMNCS